MIGLKVYDINSDIISKYIQSLISGKDKGRVVKLSPSNIGECSRRLYYKIKNQDNPFNYQNQFRTFVGTAFHALIEKFLLSNKEAEGIKIIDVEKVIIIELTSELSVRGVIDVVMIVKDDGGRRRVLDFKTTTKDVSEIEEPPQYYLDQLYFYGLSEGIDLLTLLFVNIVNGDMRRIDFELDLCRAKELRNKWLFIEKCLIENKVPEKDYKEKGKECSWCSYKKKCWTFAVED